jgi:hypothetical protein
VIAINATKLAASIKTLKGVRKRVADTADGIYRQKLYWLLEQAVMVSPQYSGQFASNWTFAVNGDMPVFRPWPGKYDVPYGRHDDLRTGAAAYRVTPHQAGDPEAVGVALARGAYQLRGVTRADRVHLVNATDLAVDETGNFMLGPDGPEKLRPENVIPTGTRIEIYVRTQAQNIPSNLKDPAT